MPLPGLDMKLIMVVPAAVSMLRTAAAEASLSARTFSSIRIVRTAAIYSSVSELLTTYSFHFVTCARISSARAATPSPVFALM